MFVDCLTICDLVFDRNSGEFFPKSRNISRENNKPYGTSLELIVSDKIHGKKVNLSFTEISIPLYSAVLP